MGSGGRMSVPSSKNEKKGSPFQRVPHTKPPFTLSEIKKAIPPHCFKRSLVRSFSYVVYDLCLAFLFYYIATSYFHLLPSLYAYFAWPIYWIFQGCILTGVWVVAHECGHHAFGDHQWVDDLVGLILHSALLVPYFSWKYSHRRHHSNTGSLERDEVFVPKTKAGSSWFAKYLNNPPGRAVTVVTTLTLGWPLYLAFNVSGRPYDRFACHFDPYSPIYSDRERLQIFISDVGIFATLYVLYNLAIAKGLAWLMCVYGVPLLIVNGFLVLITYLQHTHPSLPHYDSSEWDWVKGALATVDRDYGVLNKVFHNITDTHVAHHLFSTMPHYHAMEATNAIKPTQSSQFWATITNLTVPHFTRQSGGRQKSVFMWSQTRVLQPKAFSGTVTSFDYVFRLRLKKEDKGHGSVNKVISACSVSNVLDFVVKCVVGSPLYCIRLEEF